MTPMIHLEYPFHDLGAGTNVLAAAVALFGPHDPADILLSPTAAMPDEPTLEEFRRLISELTLPYGDPPRIRLVDAETAATVPAVLRIRATGDAALDARAILALGSAGRHLGSAYGAHGSRLRGRPELVRAELDAAFIQRRRRSGKPEGAAVRVVVMMQRVQVWGAVDTIVRAGLAHPAVELDVVLLPDDHSSFRQHSVGEVEAFVATSGVKLRDAEWLRSHLADVDVLVVPDPYITRRNTSPCLSPLELAEAGVRVVLAPYAQALSGDAANLSMLHNQPLHNMAWRIFAPSTGAVANYARRCAAGTDHVRFAGSAKRERLLTDDVAAGEAARLRHHMRGVRTVVLWNPHFVGDRELSTFDEMSAPMLGRFKENRRSGLIVRPHPRLLRELELAGYVDVVTNFRQLIAQLPNVVLDESVDATPAMLAADAMVSDLSSLIAEYHVLGRPIGLLRPTPELAFNEDRACLEGAAMIDDERGLVEFLEQVKPAGPASARSQEDLGAGARIIETIVHEFRIEAAQATAD